jgi:uncharacterized membrane protein (DUF485 family)
MTTIPHESHSVRERQSSPSQFVVREMWASIAISTMWLTVMFTAIFGPNIVNTTVGGSSSSVPCAVVLAVFAFAGTWIVARYGFHRRRDD